ncbi:Iron uptake protein A1 [Hydrogenovibrio crunogenus]|uniref:Iron uptake protein A1 n=1 Tax=Hydrogenovibrio crunogenus TaxID=39765 RepID=A0A4P7NZS8_9GAMM|nr:Fe(3+) ABC transporter substrate-binding protein [Hydrogenovibrio crunogenus]QBZ83370.1 Iron uptake protein A1 [Hydrogenovibrio crunogenus]
MLKNALLFCISISFVIPVNIAQADEVNIYSARKEQLIKPLLDTFTKTTGIETNLVTGKADALLKRLEIEGVNSPADVLITTDAGRLYRAKAAGVIQPAINQGLQDQVSKNLQDPEHYWLALTTRARVMVYAKERVSPNELSSYEALTDSKWNNRICVRSSNNIYNQSLVASMIVHKGEKATEEWATAFVKNFARRPKGGDRDQVMAVAAGQCDIAIVNTYYLGQMVNSKDEKQKQAASQVAVFWPNQQGRGTHVNISGIAITKAAKNKENALKLIEFLLSPEAQEWYAKTNNEYPVIADAKPSELLQSWGSFKSDALNLNELGIHNTQAVRIMDRAGWR